MSLKWLNSEFGMSKTNSKKNRIALIYPNVPLAEVKILKKSVDLSVLDLYLCGGRTARNLIRVTSVKIVGIRGNIGKLLLNMIIAIKSLHKKRAGLR